QTDRLTFAVRRHVAAEQGDEDQDGDDDHPDSGPPHPERDADDTRWSFGDELRFIRDGGGGSGGECGHCILVRSRGVTSTVATSAARLVTTYTVASTMTRNWMTGMSRTRTASRSAPPIPG